MGPPRPAGYRPASEADVLLLSLLFACNDTGTTDPGTPPPPPRDTGTEPLVVAPLEAGAPLVAAAEGDLKLPIGTPLGGYTARCKCLFGFSYQDERDSMYANGFVPSTGVQTYPGIKVIWIANGDDHLVLTKTDSIYSFDGLVTAITERLELATGEPLKGRVIHTANHSHSSFGTFSDQPTFYLGSDTLVRENFDRMADQIADVALEAYGELEPGRIGVGWGLDWDPNDEVYRDRRGENNDLHVWPDAEPGMGKDPHLGLIRVDDAAGQPLAMVVNFGMHGIIGSESSPLVSTDSGGHLETYLEESFDHEVVVMFAQGSGGDASPAGRGDDFAKMESIGAIGTDKVRQFFDQTPTSADPVFLETVSRHIPVVHDEIEVTRNGTVDWRYAPYDPDRIPDDRVYDADGQISSPIDEFNTENGGLFCGEGSLSSLLGSDFGTEAPEYETCMDPAELVELVLDTFSLEEEDFPLPLPESQKAGTTLTRLGPVPTLRPDGVVVSEDLLVGFFPGEATAMYGEQWRRRVRDELGDHQAMMISYAQDHEGYLLIPEDWLLGGYEPDITVWGPLAAEHTMEGVLQAGKEVLSTTLREDPDPDGIYTPTVYPDRPLETYTPDPTPTAGTRITAPPAGGDDRLWTWYHRNGEVPAEELAIPSEVPRVQGVVQLAWEGGDPSVDNPTVVIERQTDDGWEPLRSRSGRLITEADHDMLLGYTPHPLAPWTGVQTHRWWVSWQAVGHVHRKLDLPLGTYRLRATGVRYSGGESQWPFTTEAYEVLSDSFELVPAVLDVAESATGLSLSMPAPALGFRLIDLDGTYADNDDWDGDNPVRSEVQVTVIDAAGVETTASLTPTPVGARSEVDVDLSSAERVVVTDAYGNEGVLEGPFGVATGTTTTGTTASTGDTGN